MIVALALLLQAEAAAPGPVRIDLIAATAARCDDEGDEIVVCARRAGDRLAALPSEPGVALLPRAQVALPGGGTADLHGEQATNLQTGEVARRIMVGAKFPF